MVSYVICQSVNGVQAHISPYSTAVLIVLLLLLLSAFIKRTFVDATNALLLPKRHCTVSARLALKCFALWIHATAISQA